MHFHFSFYSSFLLIFFLHGILFCFLLLHKAASRNDKAHYWLAAFTFFCTLNIAPWMLGHAGWYSLQPYRDVLFYLPLQNFFLLGPLIFFYTKSLLNPGLTFKKTDWFHFLPGALYLGYSLVMFLVDKLLVKGYYFYGDGHDRDLDTWYRLAGIGSFSFYLFVSLRYYAVYKILASQVLGFADAVLFRWMKRYLVAILLMQALDIVFFLLYPDWGSFTSKWWYYFFFAALFYYIAFTAYATQVRSPFSFRLLNRQALFLWQPVQSIAFKPAPRLPAGESPEAESIITISHLSDVEKDELLPLWKDKLLHAVTVDHVYQDPEMTLTALAKKLHTNASILSKVINKGFGVNFNDFINGYRVNAVAQKLLEGEHKVQTLMGLAFDCGFNSKTTFNRVFKKHTGISPKEYIRQLTKAPQVPLRPGNEKYDVPNHDLGQQSYSGSAFLNKT